MELRPIHTLEARGNVLLEVWRDTLNLDERQMFAVINGYRNQIESALGNKGINYDDLRGALTPSQTRREIALIFDTSEIKQGWYSLDIYEQIIPLFHKNSSHSVLHGDYLGNERNQDILWDILCRQLNAARDFERRYSNMIFIVYINNLTDAMLKNFDDGLKKYAPYIGFVDTTFSSKFKSYLSTILPVLCIKHGRAIIQGHEDDLDNSVNQNTSGYPFEESGYKCLSIQSELFGILLHYKIERETLVDQSDVKFALNAMTQTPDPFSEFELVVKEDKLEYLRLKKGHSLAGAGLDAVTLNELSERIKAKLQSNYIYNLRCSEYEGTVVRRFSMMLEWGGSVRQAAFRAMAAFDYSPEHKQLRLLTFY